MCLGFFFPGDCSSIFNTKEPNKNLKTERQHGKYHPDCLKIDSCKQLANLCNEQCLVSLAIVEETVQHITMLLSILEELMHMLGGILVSLMPVKLDIEVWLHSLL